MLYLIDEDLPPDVAVIARNLDLDAVSVHEIGRRGFSDPDQFRYAMEEGRIVVTRNRDDFLKLVTAAFQVGDPSPGVLVVPRSFPNVQPAAIAQALKRWDEFQSRSGTPGICIFDFLS